MKLLSSGTPLEGVKRFITGTPGGEKYDSRRKLIMPKDFY